MTENAVESFLAVLKAGSISAAAEALYVTQPALSRAINALEKELGYSLIRRHKGVRTVELTEEGSAFLPVAEKWKALFHEARVIAKLDRANHLNIASVGSVSTYILPNVFRRLLDEKPGCHLNFRNMHSQEAYAYVGGGQMDLAIISDDMYDRNVQTIPLFRERMVLVTLKGSKYQTARNPAMLDASREIRLPWNPEFDLWHDFWFGGSDTPLVYLDQMPLLEYFIIQEDTWALAPVSVARELNRRIGTQVFEMEDAPPDRIIYLLLGKMRKPDASRWFLDILMEQLRTMDGIDV
jgi:DNA-binding transcriptional LysR family regulator